MGINTILLLLLLVSCTSYNPAKYNQYLSEARHYHAIGEWQESLDRIELIEKNAYLSDEMLILKVRTKRQLREDDESYLILNAEIKKRPHSEMLLLELAQWHLEREENSEAKALLLEIYNRGVPSQQTKKFLGYTYMKTGEWVKAQEMLEPLFQTQDEEAIFWLGQTLYKQSKFKAAVPVFSKSFNGLIFRKRAAQYLAWIHTESREANLANQYIQYLVMDNPIDQYAQKMIVRNVLHTSHPDKIGILKLFNEKFEDEWGQYQYYLELKKSGKYEEALEFLATGWNQKSGSLWLATHYAHELHGRGETDLAKNVLNKSLISSEGEATEIIKSRIAELNLKKDPKIELYRSIASNDGTYKVQSGDTLQIISQKFFNTPNRWIEIYYMNKPSLKGPSESLQLGSELLIPEARE